MNVAILAPWRPGSPERERLWEFCSAWWAEQFPEWPVHTAPGPLDGPFVRSAAINAAAELAGEWDVAVIIDTDITIDADVVRDAVDAAATSGRLVIPHARRVDINKRSTERLLAGQKVTLGHRQTIQQTWNVSESSCIAVPRSLWDKVGGFDERFEGWGYEDSAFVISCTRAAGEPVRFGGAVYHLWHPRPADAGASSPTRLRNLALLEAMRSEDDPLIPRVFHRTVPEAVDPQLEKWWKARQRLHPGWEFRTYRDPIDPALFPRTSPLWERCETGAQKADLIRLEALAQWGGIYVDADCRPVGSHEPLRRCGAFAAWEDETTIPNAVMGATANHPAILEALERSIAGVRAGGKTYATGVAITTAVFRNRPDMVILPPGIFYPHHYLAKSQAGQNVGPWTVEEHMWHHSWGDEQSKRSIAERQRG